MNGNQKKEKMVCFRHIKKEEGMDSPFYSISLLNGMIVKKTKKNNIIIISFHFLFTKTIQTKLNL